ncbi:STM4013/SEN3800 family hydrolase [Deinococcus cellulosilyticus]|uniref:Membrane protein n=1 Tax=Deinococcus cellulosilyticus (strain DSM 18568 / NBRC 106333 / KACC 11606 / 5516J-15) TaxID=1223518 RepID=A0A511N502_DEIC1|nr:STM4013/SEN3800 family hydrolase [Deinococcus cellulosilyticus]GEM47501.1 membrane protein [Deinococcus cellulosilyticus NBRC 106333 = KACC 11606]
MLNARTLIGTHDVLFITLDSLRFDVAQQAHLPGLGKYFAEWEKRHSPASFTYAAHHAFFSGFLPTPAVPGRHPRLFAARFQGSETTHPQTFVFDEATLPQALARRGYHTVCIGGVGFFNQETPLGQVLPGLFQESHWSRDMGVTSRHSAQAQVKAALRVLDDVSTDQRVFLFLNLSATHKPTHIFHADLQTDSPETQKAALEQAEPHLVRLLEAQQQRGPALVILTSDHGEAFGEDGFHGHRLGHEVVWTVPYAEFVIGAGP